MSDQDTPDTQPTARSTSADRSGPRLPPLRRGGPRKRAAGVAELAEVDVDAFIADAIRLEREEDRPPQRAGDIFHMGRGRFVRRKRPKNDEWYFQDAKALAPTWYTLQSLHAHIAATANLSANAFMAEGHSGEPMDRFKWVLYTGVPRSKSSCSASNFAYSEVLCIDLDDLPIGKIAGLKSFLAGLACGYVWHTTSTSDPRTGEVNAKIWIPCNTRMSGPCARWIAEGLYGRLKEEAGIIADPMGAGLQMPQTIPLWPSEEIRARFRSGYVDGDPYDVRDLVTAFESMEAARVASSAPMDLEGVNLDAAASRYAGYLAAIGPAVSGSGGFQHTWKAALGAHGFALDLEAAWPVLAAWNAGCSPPWREATLRRTLEAALRAERVPRGFMLAARGAPLPMEGAEGGEGGVTHPPYINNCPGVCDGLPPGLQGCVTPGVCDTLSAPDLTAAALDIHGTVYIRSGCGTGKTEVARLQVQAALARRDRAIVVVHRAALARSLARRLGLPCYLDSKGPITGSAVVCLDSIARVEADCEDSILLIIDESEQVMRHAVGGTIRRSHRTAEVWDALAYLATVAHTRLALDADLGALTIEGMRRLRRRAVDQAHGDERLYINTHHKPVKAIWFRGEAELGAIVDRRDKAIQARLEAPATALPVQVFAMAKTTADAMDEDIRREYPGARVLLTTSDTMGSAEVQACVDDPSRIAANYDVWIHTTAAGSGISVQEEFAVFGFLEAGVGPDDDDAYQALSRSRPAREWCIHTCGHAIFGDEDPASLAATLRAQTAETRRLLLELGGMEVLEGGHVRARNEALTLHYASVRARANRKALLGDIEADGVIVREGSIRSWMHKGVSFYRPRDVAATSKDIRDRMRDAKDAVRASDAIRVSEAPIIDDDELQALRQGERTPESEAILRAATIRHHYGVEDIDPNLVLRYDRGRGWKYTRNFAHALLWRDGRREPVLKEDRKGLSEHVDIECQHLAAKANIRTRLLKTIFGGRTLEEMVDRQHVLTPIPADKLTPQIVKLVKDYLGLNLARMKPQAVVGSLLRQIGLRTIRHQKRVGGEVVSTYTIDPASFDVVMRDSLAYRDRLLDVPALPTLREYHAVGVYPEVFDEMLEILEAA